jgi:hypothetical protein
MGGTGARTAAGFFLKWAVIVMVFSFGDLSTGL